MSKRVFIVLAAFFLTVAPLAANWPQWRGPALNGTSSETGLPENGVVQHILYFNPSTCRCASSTIISSTGGAQEAGWP